jgi:hypothetical protein
MTNTAASSNTASVDVPETFVEQHTVAIVHLQAFMFAVQNYVPGMPGANSALQEAMRPLRVPSGVNMANAVQWAEKAIEAEEKALSLEVQKEAALATLKVAERNRREAERLALRARKAWAALTLPVNPIVEVGNYPASVRKFRVSQTNALNVAI